MGQIPSQVWGHRTTATPFMEEAGLTPPTDQKMLCSFCIQQDNYSAPQFIVMVNGNSVCREHVINLVD